jgi:hypothetical protein
MRNVSFAPHCFSESPIAFGIADRKPLRLLAVGAAAATADDLPRDAFTSA